MKILLISNDRYFSYGMLNLLQSEGLECEDKKSNQHVLDNMMADYDLVIIDIPSVREAQSLHLSNGVLNNIIFVVDIQSTYIDYNYTLISKRSTVGEFIQKTKHCMDYVAPRISSVDLKFLQFFNSGWDMFKISSHFNISYKSAYHLRYGLVTRFGFLRYHPLISIYCEEISGLILHQKSD
ncbi:hypothetical protein ACLPHD_20310 [Serratia odorifera]|uniref:hypothetical protein n=1 Tax=Serratia odorifera TaxID=618 RepID=UPI003D284F27